jgi:hypothetical protein
MTDTRPTVGPGTNMAEDVCPDCQWQDECLPLTEEEYKAKMEQCRHVKYEKCSECGVLRRDLPPTKPGDLEWAWRRPSRYDEGQHYCPQCAAKLPSINTITNPQKK